MTRFIHFATLSAAAVMTSVATNVAIADILFQDSFESPSAGTAPVASTGTWETNGLVTTSGATLTEANGSWSVPTASPTGGSQFLRLENVGHATNSPVTPNIQVGSRNNAILSSPAGGVGTDFHFELELYASGASQVGFAIGSSVPGEFGTTSGPGPADTREPVSFQLRTNGTQVQVFKQATVTSNTAYANTGLTVATDTWYKYALDYVIGSTEITLSVTPSDGGATQSVTIANPFMDQDANGTGTTPITSLSRVDTVFVTTVGGGNANNTTTTRGYADNLLVTGTPLPEPATLGFALAAGAIVLASRKVRN